MLYTAQRTTQKTNIPEGASGMADDVFGTANSAAAFSAAGSGVLIGISAETSAAVSVA